MIIRFNGVESKPFDNLVTDHRNEILRFFDPTHPEKIADYYNQSFLVNPSNPKIQPWSNHEVQISEYQTVPVLVHLSSLTDLTSYVLPKSQSGTPGNTDNLCIGIYRRLEGGSTTIVPNIILDNRSNVSSIVAIRNDFYNFIRAKTIELLSVKTKTPDEEQKQLVDRLLMSDVKCGFEFDIETKPGSAIVRITYSPTGEVITDRAFLTY